MQQHNDKVIQEYQEFLEKAKTTRFISARGLLCFVNPVSKRHTKKKAKLIRDLLPELINLTDFLPTNTEPKVRLRYLTYNITEANCRCNVPTCSNLRQFWAGVGFAKTCHLRDKEHKLYQGNQKSINVRKTFQDKYGVDNISQLDFIKEKKKKTTLKNYGVSNPTYLADNILKKLRFQMNKNNITTEAFKKFIKERYVTKEGYVNSEKMIEDTGCNHLYPISLCKKLNIDYIPKHGRSRFEDKIIDFIKLLDPQTEVITNSRKIISPLELDIYLPEYNLAVEINGMMFHSEGSSKWSAINNLENNPERHLRKFKLCKEQGIELLQVFNELATFKHLAFEKLLAFKIGKLKWPTNQQWYPAEIIHDLLNGWPDHLIEMGYEIQEQLPPEEYWFDPSNKKFLVKGNFKEGNRRFYDCGYLKLQHK